MRVILFEDGARSLNDLVPLLGCVFGDHEPVQTIHIELPQACALGSQPKLEVGRSSQLRVLQEWAAPERQDCCKLLGFCALGGQQRGQLGGKCRYVGPHRPCQHECVILGDKRVIAERLP